MANVRHEATDRFIVFSGIGKQQTAQGVPLTNAALNTRDKCQVQREDVVARRAFRDCRDEDLIESVIDSRFARYTLTYNEVTPQIIARWLAYYYGVAAAPTGAPHDASLSVQQVGTVTGGTFTLTVSLDGRTATTKPLPYNATASQVQAALTAARMRFITPNDVVVGGSDVAIGLSLNFQEKLGRAPVTVTADSTNITGGGSINVTPNPPGADQYTHMLSRDPQRRKPFVTFAVGYDSDPTRVEKYADYVVDSVQLNASLDGNVTMQVVLVGAYEYDSIETSFAIPDCQNITPLRAQDISVSVDSIPQTSDIQSLQLSLNDNVPTDRLSAFAFDGVDIQRLRRGRQPAYGLNMTVFASETDSIYQIAHNELYQSPRFIEVRFGFSGNSVLVILPKAELRFQTTRWTTVGEAQIMAIQLSAVPFATVNLPVLITAYVEQATAFLTT
jgi:hypothetical protein